MRKKKYDKMIEERDELRIEAAKAFGENKFDKYDRLCYRLEKLNGKIRQGKK